MPSQLFAVPLEQLPHEQADKYEQKAGLYWDLFYKRNQAKFFKDRHYLDREFPDLASGPLTVLEVGCGVGNTAFPLLDLNPRAFIYACDFSATAIDLVKSNPQYACGRIAAFMADITAADLAPVPPASVDFCTMVFVLSAISLEKMPQAIRNVARCMKRGSGRVVVRDYALGDLAQTRFGQKERLQRLASNFYVRGDGTRAYYFAKDVLRELFEREGFRCDSLHRHERQIDNRKRNLSMDRRWIQATFTFTGTQTAAAADTAGSCAGALKGCSSGQSRDTCAGGGPAATPSHLPTSNGTTATASSTSMEPASVAESGSNDSGYTGLGWLAGAAGRLASQRGALPGVASGRSLLPDSLASADEASLALSPTRQGRKGRAADVEAQAEQDFFACIARDTSAVVLEEVRAAKDRGLQLSGVPILDAPDLRRVVDLPSGLHVKLASISRENRHTLAHTGLMRWEAATPLARFVLACPELFCGRHVLEVGCGANPLCTLAALRFARRVVATDGSSQALARMASNLALNSSLVVIERARLRRLAWGEAAEVAALQRDFPGGFDVVLGADVVYVEEAVPQLFAAITAMLAHHPQACVLLCHVIRRVSEDRIFAAAEAAGLYSVPLCNGLAAASAEAGVVEGPFRLALLRRR
ncbi:hypothetical protein WJX72_000046 [[Myrmecia] bisecta]|uniref:Methyltransferase type 12 domain-containing protein n=1 Tax=[Myrmecia] bisecta TaxID=41462 RepID=A0AAW1R405_9CHLO